MLSGSNPVESTNSHCEWMRLPLSAARLITWSGTPLYLSGNNWQRSHELINGNLFCTISVWDTDKGVWVNKQDVGTESNTEKEKGQASDAFKRAAFNWGIGRELYTAPFIWITLDSSEIYEKTGYNGSKSFGTNAKFNVQSIEYNQQREISKLVIVDGRGDVRYVFGEVKEKVKEQAPARTVPKNPAQAPAALPVRN